MAEDARVSPLGLERMTQENRCLAQREEDLTHSFIY